MAKALIWSNNLNDKCFDRAMKYILTNFHHIP